MNEPTHVLAWSPGYLCVPPEADGIWELETRADYEAGTPQDFQPGPDLPRGAAEGDLAAWVAGHLGYLVTLYPDTQQIKLSRFGRGRTEPIYWVRPVTMPADATPVTSAHG